MSVESIALVFAPNFVRSPSKDLEIINNNLYYERRFVEALLRHLPCSNLDAHFRPSFDAGDGEGGKTGEEEVQFLGVGGHGSGLTPHSRKSSMVKPP